jgi:hypothetical protein
MVFCFSYLVASDLFLRKAEQHYSVQQIPSSQQPVHLTMAGHAETYNEIKEMTREFNRRCT